MSGKISAEPRRNSWLERPLMIAGFQYEPPNSIGAATDAPAIALLIGPALGATSPWPEDRRSPDRQAHEQDANVNASSHCASP